MLITFIVIAADTITRSDTQTYNHCSTPQYMLETSLGTLAPEPGERFYFPIYVIVTVAVAITICCCISMVFITVCIKNSTLVCREAISRVNNQHHEIAEPVDATISDAGDSVGEMQVEMTNNVAYESAHFTRTSRFTPTDTVITKK